MLVQAAEDPAIRRGSSLRAEEMPESARRWLAKRAALQLDGVGLSLVIESADQPVGCVALNQIDPRRRRASIGCWLIESARGRGLGPAAIALLCNWGFDHLGLEEIVGLIEPGNATSIAMMSSLGFRNDGLRRRSHRIEGELRDMIAVSRREREGRVRPAPRCTAVVLAAGRGSRMGGTTPKPLRIVGGRTMLDRVVDTAMAVTQRPCVVVVPNGDQQMAAHALRRGCTAVGQGRPTGTADALLWALEETDADRRADMIVVLTADTPLLTPGSVQRLVEACAAGGGAGALLAFTPPDNRSYGRVVRGASGRVVALAEPEAPYGRVESCVGTYCLGTTGLRDRLRGMPALDGEHPLGLVIDREGPGLDVVHLDDHREGLGANTPSELAALERVIESYDRTGDPSPPRDRERPTGWT